MVLLEDENIQLKVHIFLVFHLRGYLKEMGIFVLPCIYQLVLMNEVIYFIVHCISRIYCFVIIKNKLCVWVWGANMSFEWVL